MAVVVTPARRIRESPTSARSRTPIRALGPENRNPCVGCVRSAIGGRSNGECHENALGGDRCWRCASGHRCVPVPVHARRICRQFLEARRSGNTSKGVSFPIMLCRIELICQRLVALRSAAKVALEHVDEHSSDSSDGGSKKRKKKKRARRSPTPDYKPGSRRRRDDDDDDDDVRGGTKRKSGE